jgi:hypothetical protein
MSNVRHLSLPVQTYESSVLGPLRKLCRALKAIPGPKRSYSDVLSGMVRRSLVMRLFSTIAPSCLGTLRCGICKYANANFMRRLLRIFSAAALLSLSSLLPLLQATARRP